MQRRLNIHRINFAQQRHYVSPCQSNLPWRLVTDRLVVAGFCMFAIQMSEITHPASRSPPPTQTHHHHASQTPSPNGPTGGSSFPVSLPTALVNQRSLGKLGVTEMRSQDRARVNFALYFADFHRVCEWGEFQRRAIQMLFHSSHLPDAHVFLDGYQRARFFHDLKGKRESNKKGK